MKTFVFFILIVLTSSHFIATSTFAAPPSAQRRRVQVNFPEWWRAMVLQAPRFLVAHTSPPGALPGVVIASPQTHNPNYRNHWVRDASLAMIEVAHLAKASGGRRGNYDQLLRDFTQFSRQNQTTAHLGEPLFLVNGQVYPQPWGRPQNDGPALRAIALIDWARDLISRGQIEYVQKNLYRKELPAQTVIKADLEYVAQHWREPCFDLWEEVNGHHFYTRMVQRRALMEGAQLARALNDGAASQWYLQQARAMEAEIQKHWSPQQKRILTTLNRVGGVDYKFSNLDASVILGVLHGRIDTFFSVSDPRVYETVEQLLKVFHDIYPINQVAGIPGVAIGRYPEDRYSGSGFDGGNPWVLLTLSVAEMLYERAELEYRSSPQRARLLFQKGDEYLMRLQYHTPANGSLAEQLDRKTGYMTSARDLTWNYTAILSTETARSRALRLGLGR